MPEPKKPRPLPPDPNPLPGSQANDNTPLPDFEVIDDDPPPARKPPVRAEAARPAPKPVPKPAPKPASKPAFEVVEDDDTAPAAAAKTKTDPARKAVRADDAADRRKNKPKKKEQAKTAEEHAEELRAQRLKEFEIIWPTVLLVLGVGMSFTGALGASGLNGFMTLGVMTLGLLVSIPVTIATLMVVGIVAGINYGRFGPAILKIAAITFVVNGVYFLGEWFKVKDFITAPIGCAIAFGLFKMMFDLDNGETNTSMGALNVITFLAKLAILSFLLVSEAKKERDSEPTGGGGGGGMMTDDDDDDPPPDDDNG